MVLLTSQKHNIASKELRDLAKAWIKKITVNKGGYNPDSYPNPALAYHNEQLQTSAFHEEYDPGSFEDLTMPKLDPIHKVRASISAS